MEGLRQYVISVVTAALICGIVSGIVQEGRAKPLVRLLCGLVLSLTAIRPIAVIDLADLSDFSLGYAQEAESIAAAGKEMAHEAMEDIIKAGSEAYILDKASDLNTQINVEVTISDEQLPVSAVISGEVSPYARKQLEAILQADMGIAKENQQWTG